MCNIFVKLEHNKVQQGICDLEKRINRIIPLPQKILFSVQGTLEKTLSILIGSETEVKILEQDDFIDVIYRSVNIVQKQDGRVLVNAKSKIYPHYLPKNVVKRIRDRKESIGSIIESEHLETFRRIHALGYNHSEKNFTKIYHIIHRQSIVFEIQEIFITEFR
jgi:chorismate-pyruvate lyase